MDISYDYYRIFYYVALYGSVSQAARVLRNNQPNLTRAIKNLEGELGCQLFSRSSRGMRLTPEGEKLYAHVRAAFAHLEAGEAEVLQSRNLEKGAVYVAASELGLHYALLPALKQYRGRYPGIRIKISNHSTLQAIQEVADGAADFAVVTSPTTLSPFLEERSVKAIYERAVCSRAYADLDGGKIPLTRLAAYPMVALGPDSKSYEWYSDFFAAQGIQYRPDMEAATADQILPMVRADLGVGFVADCFLQNTENLIRVDLDPPLPAREIRLVKRRGQSLSAAARELERLILA